MHAANWEHLGIILEVIAFVLVTPEFVGPGRIRQLSRWLFYIAARALQLRDVQALIPPRDINMIEFRRRMRGLGAEIRTALGHPLGRQLVLGVVSPFPLAIATIVAAYLFDGWFRWLAFISIVVFAFGFPCLVYVIHENIRFEQQPPLTRALIVFLILLPLSANIWIAFIPSWVLAMLSERTVLKGALFYMGVLLFLTSKTIGYGLVR